jgi:hypothetical protein
VTPLSNLWSQDLSTQDRHYEFHIREAPRTRHRYLTITETSILAGRRQRVALTINSQNAHRFLAALQEAISHLL